MTDQAQPGLQADQDPGQGDNGQPRDKRPRDRNGRERGPRGDRGDRGDRAERPDLAPRDHQQPLEGFHANSADTNPAPSAYVEPAARASYFAAPAAQPAAMVTTAPTAEPAAPVPSTQPAPVAQADSAPVAQRSAAAPAPVASAPISAAPAAVAAPQGLPKVQSFDLPVASLSEVAQSSGLSWVNSDPAKIASVQAAIAAEPKPIRVPRERPAPVRVDAGPLVLVETKRDLRNMTLPFEQTTPQ